MLGMLALVSPTTPLPVTTLITTDDSISRVKGSDGKIEKPISKRYARSSSTSPGLYSYMPSPRGVIEKYIFGIHSKTKRTLAEEAECGDEVACFSWIRDGVDPNEVDAYGYTPLLNAAALGRLNAVVELLKNGADINRSGPYGFHPIHAAAQNGHREVVSVLLKNGADINAQNEDKDTAMHLALRAHRIEIVYMLISNGGNVRIQGFQKKDCIQCAKDIGLFDLSNTLKNFNPTIGNHPYSAPEMPNRKKY